MAGEDLPSAIVTSDQERAKFVGEMLGELAVFDTVHHNDKTGKTAQTKTPFRPETDGTRNFDSILILILFQVLDRYRD